MKVYDAASIRNIALVGHTGSGKTQLASAILTDAGMVNRFGKVDDGTSILDTDPEEQKRHITINMALASFTHAGDSRNAPLRWQTRAASRSASVRFQRRAARQGRAGHGRDRACCIVEMRARVDSAP